MKTVTNLVTLTARFCSTGNYQNKLCKIVSIVYMCTVLRCCCESLGGNNLFLSCSSWKRGKLSVEGSLPLSDALNNRTSSLRRMKITCTFLSVCLQFLFVCICRWREKGKFIYFHLCLFSSLFFFKAEQSSVEKDGSRKKEKEREKVTERERERRGK